MVETADKSVEFAVVGKAKKDRSLVQSSALYDGNLQRWMPPECGGSPRTQRNSPSGCFLGRKGFDPDIAVEIDCGDHERRPGGGEKRKEEAKRRRG